MLVKISSFCCRFPWLVFLGVGLITGLMVQQIQEKAYFEADLIKFLPTDMPAVKSDDYSRKNFVAQDTVLIGIEKEEGTVLDPDVLRSMEAIVLELKTLKASKTFDSKLKGEVVTLEQPVGIDADSVTSIANLEDAILDKETGSVISGSVIEKLKKDLGIPSKSGEEERLPERDEDLLRIIPGLKERVMQDRSFRGSILSEDMHAATIRASTIRKQDYRRRYAVLELSTAIDPDRLTARFQGQDSTFPFEVFGKTIAGVEVNSRFIQDHSSRIRGQLYRYLKKTFQPVFADEPELKQMLDGELTAETFLGVMQVVERNDFFMNSEIGTWRSFLDELYELMINEIDPFSRENLEFQMHNVKDIVDMAQVYYLTTDLLEKHRLKGIKSYVAGSPVVIGVFSQMMGDDMQTLIPIAIGVIIVILLLSFRSVMGVLVPLITVLLSVIWTLGVMAIFKVPFTVSTSGLPIVILAIGTAYGIHLLNRYYEDAQLNLDKTATIQRSIKHVGGAILMAAITTVAGFSSLATTSLTTIQQFGQYSAIGVVVALILTLTLTPALLVLWKVPNVKRTSDATDEQTRGMLAPVMLKWSAMVIRHPGAVLVVFLGTIGLSLFLMRNNHLEGSMMSNFKEDNVLFQSDRFLNKHLTGTVDVNLIFSFRERINLESPQVQKKLQEKVNRVSMAAKALSLAPSTNAEGLMSQVIVSLESNSRNLPGSRDALLSELALLNDLLNEEYRVDVAPSASDATPAGVEADEMEALEELESLDDLAEMGEESLEDLAMSDGDDLEGLGELAEDSGSTADMDRFAGLSAEQIAGLKEIHRRLGADEDSWQETAAAVSRLRSIKSSAEGVHLVKAINELNDLLSVDIKQPVVLHKLEHLHNTMQNMETPVVMIEGEAYKPSGLIVTPVDYVRKFYKVFYHDDNPEFDRLPDVERDGFTDKTLTDRSIIGVVLNQALSADRDGFEAMITPDLKEFQVKIMIRDGSTRILEEYVKQVMDEIHMLFPADDPYIESVQTGGGSFTTMQISKLIGTSQIKSIALSFLFVFVVTFFIFRSLMGGLFALIPLLFTVILNFGFLALLGGEITMATMLVASLAIGTGVDYTIHFLERLKIQIRQGDDLAQAYSTTIATSGKAILVNATAVAAGFLVFLFSTFDSQIMLGTLVAATMFLSSIGALTLLPAVILKVNPAFLAKNRPTS